MDSSQVKEKLLEGYEPKLRHGQLKGFVTTHLDAIEDIHKDGVMNYRELAQRIEEVFKIHCTASGLRNAVYRARKEQRTQTLLSHELEPDYLPLLKKNREKKNREKDLANPSPLITIMKGQEDWKEGETAKMRVHKLED